jgi:uncharacterized membrane protein YgdD (TMEM256/DUF423 family)
MPGVMTTSKLFFILGSAAAGLAVGLGAFGAHGLKAALSPDLLANFETGARYQMYHGLALLAASYAADRWPDSRLPRLAGWLFAAGIALFSFSLYALTLTGQRWLGAVTPFGGAAFIAGWACLAAAARGGRVAGRG